MLRDNHVVDMGTKLAQAALQNFASTGGFKAGQYGALVAVPVGGKSELIEFSGADFQPEVKTADVWYASMGSAQSIADPLLGFVRESFWKEGAPELREGMFGATFVLKLACNMAPYGVADPIQLAILRKGKEGRGGWRASRVPKEELIEHEESVNGAIERLGEYRTQLAGKDQPPAGPPARPAPKG